MSPAAAAAYEAPIARRRWKCFDFFAQMRIANGAAGAVE
jgi:hypothetical protein